MTGQQWNVLRPVPQGRHPQGHDVEPVEKILAKFAPTDALFQVLIGRRDEPYVDLLGPRPPDRAHLAILDYAQQPGLERERQVSDLVQEHAAAVSQFQQTHLINDSAREGPFDMSEELALDHSFWEPCAIHQLIRLLMLGAQIVNGAGKQLLAGTGFSHNQHRRANWGDFLHQAQQGLKRRADADQGLEALRLNGHATEGPVLVQDLGHAHRTVNAGGEHLGIEWLGDVVEGAVANCLDGRVDRVEAADHDDRNELVEAL